MNRLLREDVIPEIGKTKSGAALLGISRQHLYDILKRKPVSPTVAIGLGKLFGDGARVWRECRAPMIPGMQNANRPMRSREYPQSKRRWREKLERLTREINEYPDLKKWQVAGIQKAVPSLDRGDGVPHKWVKEWVSSWNSKQ